MAETFIADDGVLLPIGELPQVIAYDGSHVIQSITVVYRGNTYVQTFSYTGSDLTGITRWTKQ